MPIQLGLGYGDLSGGKKKVQPKSFAATLGTSPATKAGLFPYMEGGLGLGLPKVAAPKAIVPKVPGLNANNFVQPYTGGGGGTADSGLSGLAGTGGATVEDLMKAIEADPLYGVANTNFSNALTMGERSIFRDPLLQALTASGISPTDADLAGLSTDQTILQPDGSKISVRDLVGRYLTPTALAAARDNPYSVAAQIARAYNNTMGAQAGEWAARGGLGAGGMKTEAGDIGWQRGLQDKQNLDELLKVISGGASNLAQFDVDQANTRRAAWAEIAARLAQQAGAAAGAGGDPNERAVDMPPGYPNIYAQTPNSAGDFSPSPFVPVSVGSETSWEPKPTAGNIIPGLQSVSTISPTTAKTLGKIKAGKAIGPFGQKLNALG